MEIIIIDLEKISKSTYEEICQFADKYSINMPENGICYVAKNEDNRIVALLNERKMTMIEPMISENPLAGKKIFDLFLKRNQNNVVRAFIEQRNLKLVEKLGFKKEFENFIIVERTPQWQEHQKEKEH